MTEVRKSLTEKNRIVLKIGSSSLTHPATGELNLWKIERLVRIICDLKGEGKEVVLVSSGAIAAAARPWAGRNARTPISEKQAYAAVGQARLMMVYQKLFSEYNCCRRPGPSDQGHHDKMMFPWYNAQNTFDELLSLGTVPIVNENDTVSTHEIQFGDNDRLSALWLL